MLVPGTNECLIVSATYPKRSLDAGYATKLLLPQEFRLSGILAQQIPQVACGLLDTRNLKGYENAPNSSELDFGPGMSERDRCLHLR
jgi:hypothetical protein